MAEKIRSPHLPAASAPPQQPGAAPPGQADTVAQHGMAKGQQMPVLHGHIPSHPDVALHARPASSSVTGTTASPSPNSGSECPPPTPGYHGDFFWGGD